MADLTLPMVRRQLLCYHVSLLAKGAEMDRETLPIASILQVLCAAIEMGREVELMHRTADFARESLAILDEIKAAEARGS